MVFTLFLYRLLYSSDLISKYIIYIKVLFHKSIIYKGYEGIYLVYNIHYILLNVTKLVLKGLNLVYYI